jgi:hypothetical protein
VDRRTGEIRAAQIFVAVLGASSYTYAEATWTQQLPDWIGSHVRAFAFFGGVPQLAVPDNLRSGVSKAHRYEPDLNPTYQDLASHYGVAVLPARVRKPRDKAKAEAGVLLVERWILAVLRNRTFFSLQEVNREIARLLERLNTRPFKKLPGSRQELFEQIDRPALRPLPVRPVEEGAGEHRLLPVEIDGHYYSVPYQLVRKQLQARFSERTGQSASTRGNGSPAMCAPSSKAATPRCPSMPAHLPPPICRVDAPTAHPLGREDGASRRRGRPNHPRTTPLPPQQGFRSCLGIMRRQAKASAKSAWRRPVGGHSPSALQLQKHRVCLLRHGLERKGLPEQQELELAIEHENIRGADYYH